MAKCKVSGCFHQHEALGFCNGHYIQWRRFGKIIRVPLMRDLNKFVRDKGFYRIELLDIKGNLVGEALIDLKDFNKCRGIKWHLGAQGYAQNIRAGVKLQHVVWGEKVLLDHINRDRLDCRKDNLRPCSMTENNRNQGLSSSNSSGYIGVAWHKQTRKWRAYIKTNGKQEYLGLFAGLVEAAHARDRRASELFGEFAVLNFDEGGTTHGEDSHIN